MKSKHIAITAVAAAALVGLAACTNSPEIPICPEQVVKTVIVYEEVIIEPVVEEEPEPQRAGPLPRGVEYCNGGGKLEDHQLIYVDGELVGVDILWAVDDEPFIGRAVAENGPKESTWDMDELTDILTTSGYEYLNIRGHFCSEEVDSVFYLRSITLQDYWSGADDYYDSSRADSYNESRSGPILPAVLEVDTSKYHHSPTLQERIRFHMGECSETPSDASRGSEIDLLVRYRNLSEGWWRVKSMNRPLIYAFLFDYRIPALSDDFSPYGGYCEDGKPVEIVPLDEAEGFKFVD